MSAFIVAKTHIDAMVQYALDTGIIGANVANDAGLALWLENYRSVSYRYAHIADDDSHTPPNSFEHEATPAVCSPLAIKLVECWRYQSCEHPEAARTAATWSLVDQIEARALQLLGVGTLDAKSYSAKRVRDLCVDSTLPWGVDDPTQITAAPIALLKAIRSEPRQARGA